MIMRFLLLLLLIPTLSRADLALEDAWIQNLPPTVPLRAGYLTITNSNDEAVQVIGLRGDGFSSIEIHRSVMKDGTMRMESVPRLVIEAGQTLRFEPGGLHLMMYPEQPTRPGDEYRIVIEFDDGSTREIYMQVRK